MFNIKRLLNKVKESHKLHKAEHQLFMNDFYFYRKESNLQLYQHRPITIFLNGHIIYANSALDILTEGSYYFTGYDYSQVSFIKLCIFYTLFEQSGQGIEIDVNGDRWKIILSRVYLCDLLKTG